jgi:uncharacterized protein HemX
MPWYVLLIIALVSLAIIVVGFAYVGLKAWRLARRGSSISKRITPLAENLGRQATDLSAKAEQLQADGEQLNHNLARLQSSLARLQVVAQTLTESLEPYLLLTGWLSGERGWNDWRRWSRGVR